MERTRTIPAENVDALKAAIRRIGRKADKLGLPAPTMTIGDRFEVTRPADEGYLEVESWVTVTVAGEAVTLDGWTVRAVIHRDPHLDAPHLVHVTSGELQLGWRTAGDICEHCHLADKGRKTLVVVEHTDGTQRIVGSTCLADFLGGMDPHDAAVALGYADDLGELLDGEDGFGGINSPSGHEHRMLLAHLLTVTAAEVRQNGWLSVTAAEEYGGLPTKSIVMSRISGLIDDDTPQILPEDRVTALAAIDWAAHLDPAGGDYVANCQAIAVRETVTDRQVGIACSIIGTYLRMISDEAAKAAQVSSVHVGRIGKRDEFAGTVAGAYATETRFGTTVWVTALDDAGNVLRWRCSGRAPRVGDQITGKATVKAHDLWGDVQQTLLTRWAWEVA